MSFITVLNHFMNYHISPFFFMWDSFFLPSRTLEMSTTFLFSLFHHVDTRKQTYLREQDD